MSHRLPKRKYSEYHGCHINTFTNRRIRKRRKGIFLFINWNKTIGKRFYNQSSIDACYRIGYDDLPF